MVGFHSAAVFGLQSLQKEFGGGMTEEFTFLPKPHLGSRIRAERDFGRVVEKRGQKHRHPQIGTAASAARTAVSSRIGSCGRCSAGITNQRKTAPGIAERFVNANDVLRIVGVMMSKEREATIGCRVG